MLDLIARLKGEGHTWQQVADTVAGEFPDLVGITRHAVASAHRRAQEPKPAPKDPGLSNRMVRYVHTIIHAALRDVADALAAYRKTADQRAEQQRLVEALDASSRLSRQRYEGGVDNYLQVLDAQRNLFQGELDLARLRQQELASIVQLYRALGGGWTPGTEAIVGAVPTT